MIERVDRFSEERVLEKLCDAVGKWRDEAEVGNGSKGAVESILL